MLPSLCKCTELPIWETDKHSLAYEVLDRERAKAMYRALGVKEGDGKALDAFKAKYCNTCHAVAVPTGGTGDPGFTVQEGVSCVACHGADGVTNGWVDAHGSALQLKRQAWRKLDRGDKETKYGMTDLWNPVKRARLCASCHIGNLAEGKLVTHAMYAAGHPPLPSFEVVAFSDMMPRHWDLMKEKPPEVQKLQGFEDPSKAEAAESTMMLLGNLVAFQTTMSLVEAQAQDKKDWPELAHFDCYACHHELKQPSWRQARGYRGAPGRPTLRLWSTALLDLAFQQEAGDRAAADKLSQEFQTKLAALEQACNQQPFGKPEAVAELSRALAKWTEQRIECLSKKEITARGFGPLLEKLKIDLGKAHFPDYDSTRQAVWAYAVLHRDTVSPEKHKALMESMGWRELEAYLHLKFPVGRVEKSTKELEDGLQRINDFDPTRLRRLFEGASRNE